MLLPTLTDEIDAHAYRRFRAAGCAVRTTSLDVQNIHSSVPSERGSGPQEPPRIRGSCSLPVQQYRSRSTYSRLRQTGHLGMRTLAGEALLLLPITGAQAPVWRMRRDLGAVPGWQLPSTVQPCTLPLPGGAREGITGSGQCIRYLGQRVGLPVRAGA